MTKRAYGLWLVFLAFLMFGNAVKAADFTLLNPSSYNAGDTIDENLVVKESEDGQKYFTGNVADRLGRVEFPVSLSGEFEVVINADWNEGTFQHTIALVSEEVELAIFFWQPSYSWQGITFAPNTKDRTGWNDGTFINNIRLSVEGTAAKLEINGSTHSEIILEKDDTVFNKLVIGGIREDTTEAKLDDRVFEVMVKTGGSQPSALTAQFSANPVTVTTGNTVKFTDQSAGSPTKWSWNFPGGTPSSSSEQNPTVTYNTAGKYDVTLTVSDTYGSDTETKTGYITVNTSSSSCSFDIKNDCKIGLEEAIYALQVIAGIRSGSTSEHEIPYILKNGCVFTVYSEYGVSTINNTSSGGGSTSTSSVQIGDMKIVIQNCVIIENSQNIPVYEE